MTLILSSKGNATYWIEWILTFLKRSLSVIRTCSEPDSSSSSSSVSPTRTSLPGSPCSCTPGTYSSRQQIRKINETGQCLFSVDLRHYFHPIPSCQTYLATLFPLPLLMGEGGRQIHVPHDMHHHLIEVLIISQT